MVKTWQGKWITAPEFLAQPKLHLFSKERAPRLLPPHEEELQHYHMLVRKRFQIDESNIDSAELHISADDYYKLYINGTFVSQGPAQHAYTHYYYNRLDVRKYLRPGPNVIAVHVYYQGLVNRAYNSGDYRQGMIAELFVNGSLALATDGQWKRWRDRQYVKGESYGYATQFVEHVDSRLSPGAWREIGYDDEHWPSVEVWEEPDYQFVEQPTPNVSVYTVAPANVERTSSDRYLIDFGHELTGQLTMKAQGRRGNVVEIKFGEELAEDSKSVLCPTRAGCMYAEQWILSGEADTFEGFDYKGFRYVELIDPHQSVDLASIRAVVRHYPFPEDRCQLHTSNELLNQIFDICKNGVKYGSQEHFVDCPTREKGQYLGDNTVIAHSHLLLTGDDRLFRKALREFAMSAAVCPGLMSVVPGHHMQEIADYSLQWPMQLLLYYRYTGDEAFLKEMAPYLEQLLQYFRRYEREDGLLHNVTDKWNLVDWPQELRDGYDFPLTIPVGEGCHNVINAFYYGALQAAAEIRHALGIQDDPAHREQVKAAFLQAFYRPDQKLFADAEVTDHCALHSNALPLLFGLAPEEAVPSITTLIRKKRFSCGVYMAYFVLQALAKAGEYELIYELITSDDERSWGNMVREGATACFEAWGKDQKWNTSLCHPWASAPIPVLIEHIFGVTPGKPGWKEIRFAPNLPKQLSAFTLQVPTKAGVISLSYSDGELKAEFPDGVPVIVS